MVTPITKPTTIVEPFAINGPKNTIPVAPNATPGSASLDQGFPSSTMVPVYQGGVPPSGLDFNGILNWITQHTVWVNAGGMYTFDASLVTAAGGYKKGAVVMSDDLASTYVSTVDNNTTNFNTSPGSIGQQWLAIGGAALITRAGKQFSDYYQDAGTVANGYVLPGLDPNPELVANGDFSNGTTGWAASSSWGSTAAVVGGEMQVTTTVAYGRQLQAIAGLTVGKTYQLSAAMRAISGSGATATVGVSTQANGSTIGQYGPRLSTGSASPVTLTGAFVAQATTMYLVIGDDTGTGSGWVLGFDNVSVKDTGELVTNGRFTTDASGWTALNGASLSVAGGQLTVTNDATGIHAGGVTQAIATTVGQTYRLSADCIKGSATNANVGIANVAGGNSLGELANTPTAIGAGLTFTATAATTYVSLYPNTNVASATAIFDNVSVKPVPAAAIPFKFRTTRANTGPSTVDIGQGIYPLRTEQGAELAAGDIAANSVTSCVFDPALGYAVVTETVASQLGTLAKENIGQGLEDDGAGNLRVKLADSSLRRTTGGVQTAAPVTSVNGNLSLANSHQGSTLLVTGAYTITAPATSSLWNGYAVSINAQGGTVTFAVNAADKANGGAAGTGVTVIQGQTVDLITDGAGNWWSMFQTTPQGAFSPRYITGSQTLGAGTYWVDTTAGPITITLATGVTPGTVLEFSDATGTWGVNPLTLARNGNTILGVADNLVCDVNGETFKIWFNGTDWRLF